MKIDLDLVKRLQSGIAKGEQNAFEDLYRLFFPRLFNFALLLVHRKEAAEEIVNDVMIKIWQKQSNMEAVENLETYLFVATRNHALNYLQKYSHLNVFLQPESGAIELVNLNDPHRELEWREVSFRLTMAVEALPEQCKTVFKLVKEEGFKYKQVAEILGLSVRTVETQLFRAIKKLTIVLQVDQGQFPGAKNRKGLFILLFPIFFLLN